MKFWIDKKRKEKNNFKKNQNLKMKIRTAVTLKSNAGIAEHSIPGVTFKPQKVGIIAPPISSESSSNCILFETKKTIINNVF